MAIAMTKATKCGQESDREDSPAHFGFSPGAKDWYLFTPTDPIPPLSPMAAAAKHLGETIDVDGGSAPVAAFFKTILRRRDSAESEGPNDRTVLYGFTARSPSLMLLARWNENRIAVCRGVALSQREVENGSGR
jgi:hypothetical protein